MTRQRSSVTAFPRRGARRVPGHATRNIRSVHISMLLCCGSYNPRLGISISTGYGTITSWRFKSAALSRRNAVALEHQSSPKGKGWCVLAPERHHAMALHCHCAPALSPLNVTTPSRWCVAARAKLVALDTEPGLITEKRQPLSDQGLGFWH